MPGFAFPCKAAGVTQLGREKEIEGIIHNLTPPRYLACVFDLCNCFFPRHMSN